MQLTENEVKLLKTIETRLSNARGLIDEQVYYNSVNEVKTSEGVIKKIDNHLSSAIKVLDEINNKPEEI